MELPWLTSLKGSPMPHQLPFQYPSSYIYWQSSPIRLPDKLSFWPPSSHLRRQLRQEPGLHRLQCLGPAALYRHEKQNNPLYHQRFPIRLLQSPSIMLRIPVGCKDHTDRRILLEFQNHFIQPAINTCF